MFRQAIENMSCPLAQLSMIDWTKTVPGPKVLSHIHWVPILCIAGTEKCKQHMRKKREPVSSGTAINSSNINTRL